MLLQLALDAPEHFAVLPRVADLVHVVEVGTPLLKRFGLSAISTARELAPGVPVLADTKTADGGALEAEMVFGAGAVMMTLLADASPATHRVVDEVAQRYGAYVVVDTILSAALPASRDLFLPRSSHVALHAPSDARLAGERQTRHIEAIAEMHALGYEVSLAGGVSPDNLAAVTAARPDIVVVGSAITQADNPREVTQWMVSQLDSPGRGRSSQTR